MTLEEQIIKGIEEYNKELDKKCKDYNEEREKELNERLEKLKEQVKQQKGTIDLSKIKPPKYPMCYDCFFENKEEQM